MQKQVSQSVNVITQLIIGKHSKEVDMFGKLRYCAENDAKRMKLRQESMKLIHMKVHIDSNLYPRTICPAINTNIVHRHE